MEITTGNLYFIKDSFFQKVHDPYLKINYADTKRPHYFAFQDETTSLYWLVPCSSRIEKFERILEKKREQHKPTDTIKIVKIQDKKTALLFQDMFPMIDSYIDDLYIRGGQIVRIADPRLISELEKTARKVIKLIRKGVRFTPTQPDALHIEKIMLEERKQKPHHNKGVPAMTSHSFDSQRIAEGYARRPWLHKTVMEQIRKDCNIKQLRNGLDVGCGAGLSTKALRMLCDHVTGTDISPEMIAVCEKLYQDPSYTFFVSRAEETEIPAVPYDIITAAGVVNWVDRELFLKNAEKILADNGLIVVYDFWITDRMEQGPEYTEWYQKKYLNRFPKPYRKEAVWSQQDLTAAFRLENRVTYDLTYEFSLDEFIDFMMIQSNVNEQIEKNVLSSEDTSSKEARSWMADTLCPVFDGRKRTLLFEGYNWYIRKSK